MDFTDRTYLIMGGTSGMGLASAIALNNHGANLVVVGKQESCDTVDDQLLGKTIVLPGEARIADTIEKAIEVTLDNFGIIDGLFHVAGGSGRRFGDGPLHEMTDTAWQETISLNLDSVMYSNRAMLRYFMKNGKRGKILNMGSVLAAYPSPSFFATHAYTAAKSALIGYTKSLAAYYARYNIAVNLISPGLMDTPMARRAVESQEILDFLETKQPLDHGRPGAASDIVDAVLMFLSPSNRFMTGQVLHVDGGWSVSEGQYR